MHCSVQFIVGAVEFFGDILSVCGARIEAEKRSNQVEK